ncbi:MAG: TolC family protein [Chitinophagales bacterium]
MEINKNMYRISNRIKCLMLPVLLFICLGNGFAQTMSPLRLDSCYEMAKRNYPLIKKYDLVAKTAEFNISNAGKAYLPQVSLNAIGAYLYTGIPAPPGKEDSKFKFIGIMQVNQAIWDGGATKAQKDIIKANQAVEENGLAVSLYGIRERVNQIYFGILVIDEQLRQLNILTDRFAISLQNVKTSKENGYGYQSDIDEVKAEILNTEQRQIEFIYSRKKYVEMLSYLIGHPLSDSVQLQMPALVLNAELQPKNRPEISLFTGQRRLVEAQLKQIKVANMPKLGLIGIGALIQPGFYLGQNQVSGIGVAGLSLSWDVGGLYRSANNRELNRIQLDKINNDEEVFRFNNGLELKQGSAEIESQSAILRKDVEIVALKGAIVKSYQLKYNNGLCSMNDLLNAMNKESEAKRNQLLHEVQLVMSTYNYKTAAGN